MAANPAPPKPGCLFGVGVGPGDPELLTLKAQRVLQSAPVIFAPQAETQPDSYALNIVRELLDFQNQEIVRLVFPTDNPTEAASVWRDAACTATKRLRAGQDVAFITEGDPMLYSTFGYMLEAATAENPGTTMEIIPGVSSINAAAATARAPLATQGQCLAVLPAAYGIDDLSEAITKYDAIVLMKVNRTLLKSLADLETLGLSGKAIYVRRVSTQREQVIDNLRELSEEDMDYFSLLIIRK